MLGRTVPLRVHTLEQAPPKASTGNEINRQQEISTKSKYPLPFKTIILRGRGRSGVLSPARDRGSQRHLPP
jgi:hypothetical protein